MAQRYMSEREFNKKLREIQKENESLRRINKLEEERSRLRKPKKKLSASKIALLIMFLVVFEIVIFTEWLMFKTQDLSALYVLIGIPATMIVPLWKYYSKSEAENTRGGIVYDAAMKQMEPSPIDDSYITDLDSGDFSGSEQFPIDNQSGQDFLANDQEDKLC